MEESNNNTSLINLIKQVELATAEGSVTNQIIAAILSLLNKNKVDIVEGKGLSTNDFTDHQLEKLNGIAAEANKYVLPDTLPASMIEESSTRRFVSKIFTDQLTALLDCAADWKGAQEEYNALGDWDAGRWYFIEEDDAVAAVFRGSQLIYAEPNCIGQFADDSVPDDWYWWPNGEKTPLPVDPSTKRFAFYYPQPIAKSTHLFAGGSSANAFNNTTLIALERLPAMQSVGSMLANCRAIDRYPVIDLGHIAPSYNIYYSCNYMVPNTSKAPRDLYFKNTEKMTQFEQALNSASPNVATRIYGLDLSRVQSITARPFGQYTAVIEARNLGARKELTSADLRSSYWGDDEKAKGARQSVVDTLLTNSFDRVAAGYDAVNVRLSTYTYSVLTTDEIAAITAKGYTLTQE